MTKNDKKYNVYIVNINSGEAVSLVGSNMSEDRAEKREMIALQRIDRKRFFVTSFESDSVEAKKSTAQSWENKY